MEAVRREPRGFRLLNGLVGVGWPVGHRRRVGERARIVVEEERDRFGMIPNRLLEPSGAAWAGFFVDRLRVEHMDAGVGNRLGGARLPRPLAEVEGLPA